MLQSEFLQNDELRQSLQAELAELTEPLRLTQRGGGDLYSIFSKLGIMPVKEKDENGKDPSHQPLMKMREAVRALSLPYENEKGQPKGQQSAYTPYGVATGFDLPLNTKLYAVPVNAEGNYSKDGEVEAFDEKSLPKGTPRARAQFHRDTIGVSGFTFSPDWLRNTQNFPGVGEVTGAEFVALAGMNKGGGKGKPSSIAGIRLNTQPQPAEQPEAEEVDGDGSAES